MVKFLILIYFIILSLSVEAHAFCKNDIEFSAGGDEDVCQTVCTKAIEKKKDKYSLVGHTSTANNFQKGAVLLPVQSQLRCLCYYVASANNNPEVGSDTQSCEYVATVIDKDKKVKINNIDALNKPVDNLLSIATLRKIGNVSGDISSPIQGEGKLFFATSIIANVYYRGLHYFSSYYALILLTILFAGTLFIFGFSNFYTILKSPGQLWSLLTSTDFKSKASQVILAVIFFGLPVNIDTVYSTTLTDKDTKSDTIKYSNFLMSEFNADCAQAMQQISKQVAKLRHCAVSVEDVEQMENIMEYLDAVANDPDYYDEEIMNDIKQQLKEMGLEECLGNIDKFMQDIKNADLSACKFSSSQEQKEDALGTLSSPDNTGNTEDDSLIKRTVLNEKNLSIPLAAVVVAGFVDFGKKAGETIAKWSTESVKQFFYYKLTKDNATYNISLGRISSRIYGMSNTLYDTSIKVDAPECFGSISDQGNCESIIAKLTDVSLEYKASYCKDIIESAYLRCVAKQEISSAIKKAIEKVHNEKQDQLYSKYNSVFKTIEDNFSFLSPAVLPMVIVVYPFTVFSKEQPGSKPVVTAEKVNESFDKPLIIGAVDSITSPIKKAWGKIKGTYSSMSSTFQDLKSGLFLENSPSTMIEQDVNKIIGNNIGKDQEFAYWLGYSSVMANIPPGSIIKKNLSEKVGQLIEIAGMIKPIISMFLTGLSLLSAAAFFTGPWGAVIGTTFFISLTIVQHLIGVLNWASPIVKLVVDYAITYIAVNISTLIFVMLPFCAIFIAGVIRFIHYLYEIMKTMIVLPFYALPVGTRRAEGIFLFFGDLIKLSILPPLIAAGIAFAIFFSLIFELFVFDFPLSIMVSQLPTGKHLPLFIFGVLVACLQVVTTIVVTYYLFKITMGFPEYVISSIGRIIQAGAPSREYSEFASTALHKIKTMSMVRM